MRLFLNPPLRRDCALAFDLDGTLYDNPQYMKAQEESQVAELAHFLGVAVDAAAARIQDIRETRRTLHLAPASLGDIFRELGVSDNLIVQWRIENIHPRTWLSDDSKLRDTLRELSSRHELALITNNPKIVGIESLRAMGVRSLFTTIVGLDDTFKSKPHPAPFRAFLEAAHRKPADCVVIGDRYSVDIEPALQLGMQGILIEAPPEVHLLPELLG